MKVVKGGIECQRVLHRIGMIGQCFEKKVSRLATNIDEEGGTKDIKKAPTMRAIGLAWKIEQRRERHRSRCRIPNRRLLCLTPERIGYRKGLQKARYYWLVFSVLRVGAFLPIVRELQEQ